MPPLPPCRGAIEQKRVEADYVVACVFYFLQMFIKTYNVKNVFCQAQANGGNLHGSLLLLQIDGILTYPSWHLRCRIASGGRPLHRHVCHTTHPQSCACWLWSRNNHCLANQTDADVHLSGAVKKNRFNSMFKFFWLWIFGTSVIMAPRKSLL
jgi:hypothetical protein